MTLTVKGTASQNERKILVAIDFGMTLLLSELYRKTRLTFLGTTFSGVAWAQTARVSST